MSKYVKNLVTQEYSQRLEGVTDLLLVNVIGLDANKSVALRKRLREKGIRLMVVKTTLVRRAVEGTPLAAAFKNVSGSTAVVWGAEDIVSLSKEIAALSESKDYALFEPRGGVMDGQQLTSDQVKEISKWPSREEQLSILSGQLLSPGANLVAAILGPGAALGSQIKQKSEEDEGENENENA